MILAPPVEYLIHLSKKAFDRLHCIFHFGTENGKDQLKNTLHKYDWEGGSGKISWRSRGRSGRLANFWLASSREASPPNSVQQKVAKHWTSKQPPKQSGLKEEKTSLIRSVGQQLSVAYLSNINFQIQNKNTMLSSSVFTKPISDHVKTSVSDIPKSVHFLRISPLFAYNWVLKGDYKKRCRILFLHPCCSVCGGGVQ